MRYASIKDGALVEAKNPSRHYIKCCNCGLVHRFKFRVVKGKLQYEAHRLRKRA